MTAPIDRFSPPVTAPLEPLPSGAPQARASVSPARRAAHQVTAWAGVAHDTRPSIACFAPPAQLAPCPADLAAFDVLDQPLASLARRYPDGDASAFRHAELTTSGLYRALQDRGLEEALSRLPREVAVQELEARIHARWPRLGADDLKALTDDLAARIDDGLRQRAAFTLRDAAVGLLRASARNFEATAASPEAVCEVVRQLDTLERTSSTEAERDHASALREALGLEDGAGPVDPPAVAEALRARAKLQRREAWDLEGAGLETIYRRMAKHDVRALVAREAGVEPGSWTARQLDGVKTLGDAQAARLEAANFATVLALCAVSGGLGLTGAAGATFSAGIVGVGAAEVAVKFAEVPGAAAGESAGTMAAGAGQRARTEALFSAAELALVSGAAQGVTHATHRAVSQLASRLGAPELVKGAAHAGIHAGLHPLEAVLADHPDAPRPAPGRDALRRLATAEER